MVSTRKMKQSNRKLLSQLDDFDRDIIIGNATNNRQENVVVSEATVDLEFVANITRGNITANEGLMIVKT